MSDIFTLKTVQITPELGMALKNFRIEHDVTATSIITEFEKPATYISKLEKGDIKKVDSVFFSQLCAFITKTDDGLIKFLTKTRKNIDSFTQETKNILTNIDELLVEHDVPFPLLSEIENYMQNHSIHCEQLVNKINSNEDIVHLPAFSSAPVNMVSTYRKEDGTLSMLIRLDIPFTYVDDLLSGKIKKVHYIIVLAILYALYRLGNENDAHSLATNKLQLYKIMHYAFPNIISLNEENMDNLFGGLTEKTSKDLHAIASTLKIIASVSKEDDYSTTRIQQIKNNLYNDLGFAFAFMSLNLDSLFPKSKDQKKQFLNEVKLLITKYSQSDTGLDLYE